MTPPIHPPRRPGIRPPRPHNPARVTAPERRDARRASAAAASTTPSDASAAVVPSWQPLVSVVIPTLNEERHIEDCLASVFDQTYPPNRVEVIVADGGSSDATRDIVTRLMGAHTNLRLIDNPAHNQAAGLNLAIAASSGEVVARLDGHAAWRPPHLERCVALLEATGADNVGGRMEAVGETPVASAVACATGSPFGVGAARFHYASHMLETDTVFLGCFRRSALERAGRFNESYPPHEDYELNYRIRTTGGRIVFSPEIPTTYWARATWRSLARQYFRYGRAKMRVARRHPGVLRPHHFAAPALVAGSILAVPALGSDLGRRGVIAAGAAYAVACVAVGLRTSRGATPSVRARVPLVFPVLHLCWGSGFWSGLVSSGRSTASRTHEGAVDVPIAAPAGD
jgi:succinoglycan biosynthesis protein ExoA